MRGQSLGRSVPKCWIGALIYLFLNDLEGPGNAVEQLEHSSFIGRAEPKRIGKRSLCNEVFTATPGSIS